MNIVDIITKKRDKKELTKEEINYFVTGYTKGIIPDYQAAAFIMATYLNGMTKKETTYLAIAMADSGDRLNLSSLGKIVVDKHSTGGVGDKVTLILAPIIASFGIPVAKMSGRGLGFTGGTVDKLESIPGYQTNIPEEQFIENVKKIGISLIGQTLSLAPADKKIYALRDAISCTESIPLIASSIMSKKIASGSDKIVLDVTCGSGAFMKTKENAKKLAVQMKEIGDLAGKETVSILTNMDQPLGYSVGNILEVKEVINALKGNMAEDVKQVVLELGAYMLKLAGKGKEIEQNKKEMLQKIQTGEAYRKWKQLVENQGGDSSYIEHPEKWEQAPAIGNLVATEDGYIQMIQAGKVGTLTRQLGAGRLQKEDKIDPRVGIIFHRKVGDKVKVGDILATIYAKNESELENGITNLKEAYHFSRQDVEKPNTILGIIA